MPSSADHPRGEAVPHPWLFARILPRPDPWFRSFLLGPAKGMAERLPGAILLGGGDALRDEVHAVDPVGDVGIETAGPVHLLTAGTPGHVVVGGGVDVGEGFEEGLGMAAGKARAGGRGGAEVRPPGARV